MLHGSSASSMTFRSAAETLIRDFDRYAVDLPGFGISGVEPAAAFRSLGPSGLAAFYVEVLRQCVEGLGLERPHLVGHSLGGYLSVEFARAYPHLVDALVLVDPAGLLPTLGDLGFYWAVVFKLGLPATLVRALGSIPSLVGRRLADEDAAYWLSFWSCAGSRCDLPAARLIDFEVDWPWRPGPWLRSFWNTPNLHKLLALDVRVGLVWGEADTIAPARIGSLLCAMAPFPCFVVRDAWHSPGAVRGGAPFATALRRATDEAAKPGPRARAVGLGISRQLRSARWRRSFGSTPSRAYTGRLVARQHGELRDIAARGLPAQGKTVYV